MKKCISKTKQKKKTSREQTHLTQAGNVVFISNPRVYINVINSNLLYTVQSISELLSVFIVNL